MTEMLWPLFGLCRWPGAGDDGDDGDALAAPRCSMPGTTVRTGACTAVITGVTGMLVPPCLPPGDAGLRFFCVVSLGNERRFSVSAAESAVHRDAQGGAGIAWPSGPCGRAGHTHLRDTGKKPVQPVPCTHPSGQIEMDGGVLCPVACWRSPRAAALRRWSSARSPASSH